MRHIHRTFRGNEEYLRSIEELPFAMPSVGQGDHPFSGQLVDGNYAANWLKDVLSKSNQSVDLCSAFLRSEALYSLLSQSRMQFEGRILARWQYGDLHAGASDLQSYVVAKELGFKFFIRQDFHGKVFSAPGIGIVVGSANATLAGFGMKDNSNAEVCTLVPPLESNLVFINGIFNGAVEIDETLFAEIGKALIDAPFGETEHKCWPEKLMAKLLPQQTVNRFLTSECLVSLPNVDESGLWLVTDEHDRKLLGLQNITAPRLSVVVKIKALKVHGWFIEKLRQAGGEMYFGSVTAELHYALLDDPVAYRQDVKILLQTLLSWYELLPECGILIDRPNYSQRIRLR